MEGRSGFIGPHAESVITLDPRIRTLFMRIQHRSENNELPGNRTWCKLKGKFLISLFMIHGLWGIYELFIRWYVDVMKRFFFFFFSLSFLNLFDKLLLFPFFSLMFYVAILIKREKVVRRYGFFIFIFISFGVMYMYFKKTEKE